MTKLLIALFAKGDPAQPAVRAKTGKLSGFVGIVCNILLCAMKLIVGTLCGSVSITADAMNNLSDATSSVVTLIGFRLAERPADDDHPYGHARYEYLSGLAVAAMIIVIGFELAKTSLDKILHPEAVEMNLWMVLVLVGSILVKLWLCLFNRRLGKRISSQTLLATAADSRNDVIATSAVLIAVVVEYLTDWKIDGWMGMAVALFILYSGVSLAKQTISPLLGETASPQLQQFIVDVVCSEPKILGSFIGLYPLLTLFSVYAGAKLAGFFGIFLFPIAAITLKNLNEKGIVKLFKNPPENNKQQIMQTRAKYKKFRELVIPTAASALAPT